MADVGRVADLGREHGRRWQSGRFREEHGRRWQSGRFREEHGRRWQGGRLRSMADVGRGGRFREEHGRRWQIVADLGKSMADVGRVAD